MDTFKAILDKGGTGKDLATALGCSRTAVYSMRDRDYVPAQYWRRLRVHLAARGIVVEAATLELIAERRG